MADNTPDQMSDADLLRAVWRANLINIWKALQSGDAKASHLDVARKFLADNGIRKDTLERQTLAESLRGVMDDLPFKDDLPFPEGGAEGA